MNNNPFLNLLNEENFQKIRIDKQFIPLFKDVIRKLASYFENNNLLDVRDWESFFKEYLLDGDRKLVIRAARDNEIAPNGAAEYKPRSNEILLSSYSDRYDALFSSLCHEFIHFLVMVDSPSLGTKPSTNFIFNEGLTELFTMDVMGTDKTSSSYFHELAMARYYCLLSGKDEAFRMFLNDKFTFDNDSVGINLERQATYFDHTNSEAALANIQYELIKEKVDFYSISTFKQYLDCINVIASRVIYDIDRIKSLYEMITDSFLENIGKSDDLKLKSGLMNLCELCDKAHIYGDNEVAECFIDGITIGLDKNGNSYNQFPKNGEKYAYVSFNGRKYTICHNDVLYEYNVDELKTTNWTELYKMYLDYYLDFDFEPSMGGTSFGK